MPVTRDSNDFNSTTEWTDSVLSIPNQSRFIKGKNLFDTRFTNQEAVLFDKIDRDITLLPDSNRRGGPVAYGKDDSVTTFSLALPYFDYNDYITKSDYQSKRRAGTADEQDTLANVIAGKLLKGRQVIEQVHEYMMLQAIKGISTTPEGTVLANMFTEFGISQSTVDFDLGTSTTDVRAKIAEVKDTVQKNLKTGGIITGPLEVIVDRSFFDKFISHPNVRADYLNSSSNVRYQQDLSDYMSWGISDVFEYGGIRLMVYSHVFNLPDGTTENSVATDTGHVIPNVAGDSIFKGWYGPSMRLDVDGGSELFAWEYRDAKQMYHEIKMETAPLFICVKPASLVKLTTST